jgi:hypothetical protein
MLELVGLMRIKKTQSALTFIGKNKNGLQVLGLSPEAKPKKTALTATKKELL